MWKRITSIVYLVAFALLFSPSATRAESFDPEAISQVSKAIAEWKLINEGSAEELPVYVSSSLTAIVEKGGSEGIGVVSGLRAFEHEYRPVRIAIDYWHERANIILDTARPDNWVWTGIQATGYDVAGKFIQHFPVFNPLSMEEHAVTVIDPMNRYTTLEQVGAGVGLAGDVLSPFGGSMLKGSGTHLLRGQVHQAVSLQNFQQLHRSTEFLVRGTKIYDTIGKLNRAYDIGVDTFNLHRNAVSRETGVGNWGGGIGKWNAGIGVGAHTIGAGMGRWGTGLSAHTIGTGIGRWNTGVNMGTSHIGMGIPNISPMSTHIPSIPRTSLYTPIQMPKMPVYTPPPISSSRLGPRY